MNKFSVNYRQFFYNFIPHFLRGNVFVNYLYTIADELRALNFIFVDKVDELDNFALYDSRVLYFEGVLNKTYDDLLNRITVDTFSADKLVYMFNLAEPDEAEVILFNRYEARESAYFYNIGETLSEISIKVNVPSDVTASDVRRSKRNGSRSTSRRR
jgi:hypothetical protein